MIGENLPCAVSGELSAERAARTRNKCQMMFLFRSAKPLGVPAFVIDVRERLGIHPLLIRRLLFPLAIHPPHRLVIARIDARLLRQLPQILHVTLARVAPHESSASPRSPPN